MRKVNMSQSHCIKFTQLAVERLCPLESGRVIYWDLLLPGFGIRVAAPRRDTGRVRKSWVCMYRVAGKQGMETIRPMTPIPKIEEARKRARDSMEKAQQGINPVSERRARKASGVGDSDTNTPRKNLSLLIPTIIDNYLLVYATGRGRSGKPRRRSTVKLVESYLNPVKIYQPSKLVDGAHVEEGDNWEIRYIDDLTRADVRNYCKNKGDSGATV